jgi:hypothetical protein
MKSLIFAVMAVCSLTSAYAQKETLLIFGNTSGVNNVSVDDNSQWRNNVAQWLLNAGAGYQVSQHVTLGLQGGYYHSLLEIKQTQPGGIPLISTTSGTEYGVGAFCRYTQYLGDIFFVGLQADAGYNRRKASYSDNFTFGSVSSANGIIGADIFPTVGAFIYRKWALNFGIGGINYRYSHVSGVRQSFLNFNFGHSATIGLSKNISFHKKANAETAVK